MSPEEAQRLQRENDYLKLRCAQLQEDVVQLSDQVSRLQQQLERAADRRAATRPNPLSGGQ
jgi:predicted  nucleic acid-binding Zn-ribbon protein